MRGRIAATLHGLRNGQGVASRLVRGSSAAFLISGAGQGLTFGLQLLFARELGVSEYGVYSYLFSWMAVGLIFAKGGFDTALLRYVAAYSANERPDRARGVIQTAVRQAAVFGTLTVTPICLAAWLAAKSGGISFAVAVLIMGVLVPMGACAELIAAGVRGLGRAAQSLIGDMMLRPIVTAVVSVILLVVGFGGAPAALSAYLVGTIASLLLSRRYLRRALSWDVEITATRLKKFWSRSSALMMLANGVLMLLYSVDVLMLGSLDGVVSSGLYNVAAKLAVLVIFIMNAAQSVAGPMMAAAYASGRHAELQRIVRLYTAMSALCGAPIAGVLAAGSPWILRAFGAEFVQASGALLVLLGMQIVNAATGPVGLLLAMTGRQSVLAWLLLSAVVINVLLNFYLIPRYGLIGAAWSSFVAHTAWNVAGVVLIRRLLRIDCSVAVWFRGALPEGA